MDGVIIFVAGLLLFIVAGSVCGIVAVAQLAAVRREVARLDARIAELTRAKRLADGPLPLGQPVQTKAEEASSAPPVKEAQSVPTLEPEPSPPPPPKQFTPQALKTRPLSAGPAFAAEPAPVDWRRVEEVLGRKWTVWVGVLILLAGMGFFVKYAFEQGWISPAARVGAGMASGLALAVAGARFYKRRMRALGQGLMGGGLGLLYLSLFAGYSFYDGLIPLPWAFGAMICVTVFGAALALLLDAQPICALAAIGGFLTPLLLHTGQDARDALFAYVLMLDLGILAVVLFKGWRLLDGLALLGTAVLFTAWAHRFCPIPAPAPAVAWLAAFYAVLLVMPLAFHLRCRQPIKADRFVQVFACAAYFLAIAHWIAGPAITPLALASLAAAAAYVGLGFLVRLRIPQDRRSLHGLAALAMFFLALAPYIVWDYYDLTLAWAFQAVTLIALGCRFRYLPMRIGGDVLLSLAGLRLIVVHPDLPVEEFVPFATRESVILWAVVAAGAAAAGIRQRFRKQGGAWDGTAKVVTANLAGLAAVVGLHRELRHWRALAGDMDTARWLVSLVWTAGASAFMAGGVKLRCAASRMFAAAALMVAMILAAVPYYHAWRAGRLPVINPAFAAGMAAVAAAFAFGWALARFKEPLGEDAKAAPAFHVLGVATLFLLLSAEAVAACKGLLPLTPSRGWITQMTLSLVWTAYAFSLLCFGFWRGKRPVRLAGLGFFGLTATKVVLLDMASVRQLYRIGAFVALGMLLIGASYLYHRLERYMEGEASPGKGDSGGEGGGEE